LEDDINFLKGRLPRCFKLKTTLTFLQEEDDLNFLTKWKTISIFFEKMEDDQNIFTTGRRPQHFCQMEDDFNISKWKMTSIFCQLEDDLIILANGRRPEKMKI
jgi:hypothetical protein